MPPKGLSSPDWGEARSGGYRKTVYCGHKALRILPKDAITVYHIDTPVGARLQGRVPYRLTPNRAVRQFGKDVYEGSSPNPC